MATQRITIATFEGILIPGISVLRETGGELADRERTAGGLERSDTIRGWRQWEVRTVPIPEIVVETLKNRLNALMWGYGLWWCYEMGQGVSPVKARIPRDSFSSEIVLGRRDMRYLSFSVIEQ